MKKLMIAAAAMAMIGGAFADCIDPEDPEVANCAAVYNVNVTLKTLASKSKSYTLKVECTDPETISACYLVNGTRKYAGVIASCSCTCEDTTLVADPATYFWSTTLKAGYCDTTITLDNVIRFGGETSAKSKKAAATIGIAGGSIALTGAGFGTYSPKQGRISSISGYVAGLVDAPVCSVKCDDPLNAYGFGLCDENEEEITPEQVPAYGTWSVKYNSSASKKYMNDSTYVINKLLPTYYVADCLAE